MSSPWMKFYPSDWRADPALRMCSVGARGLWMEMLCVMHEAEPYGSMRVNGRRVEERQIAALAGAAVDDVSAWLCELEDSGVFSRDDEGAIISRRMQRDKAKAEADRANGKRGGNPDLSKGVNLPVKAEDKAQKPEARDQIEGADAPSTRARAKQPAEFDGWYSRYPHKVSKGQAEKAYAAARKLASSQELLDGLERYISAKPADQKWRNPATWLNGQGWLDEPAENPRTSTGPPRQRGVFDAAVDGINGNNKHGSAGIFGDSGDAQRISTAKRSEPGFDAPNIRGGLAVRFVPGRH